MGAVALVLLFAVCVAAAGDAQQSKPNVLFILTDDQDTILSSLDAQPKLRHLIQDPGFTFTHGFAATPICCPSRAEIQTGRYMHNTKVDDNGCGGTAWQQGPEKSNVAHFAKQAGYNTYYSGKYLNNYGSPDVGGTAHIPQGWDEWMALVGNSKYYNYDISQNGKQVHFGDDYATDYYTDKMKNDSVAWLKSGWDKSKPFFMMKGYPCPHVPNIYAPQYADMFRDKKSPRTPNWNHAPADATGPNSKHWMMRQFGPMDEVHQNQSDVTFADRWRCLQSVDDMVEEVVNTLESLGVLNNTYIIYSSDHGQHLGQFGMAWDKRQLYETDIRVPLLVRGPGIVANGFSDAIASHVDLAPTILDMMGVKTPEIMDGRSWLHIAKGATVDDSTWRTDVLVEYGGPSRDAEQEYERKLQAELAGVAYTGGLGKNDCGDGYSCQGLIMCGGEEGNCPCDARNNTYKCLRTRNSTENSVFCVFDDSETFVEWYDLDKDPWHMNNLAGQMPKAKQDALHSRLRDFMYCAGPNCFNPPPAPPPSLPGSPSKSRAGQPVLE